jgi:hypothetical protein
VLTPYPIQVPIPVTVPVSAPGLVPVLNSASYAPAAPRTNEPFTVLIQGSGFDAQTSQVVVTGPACPGSCLLIPAQRTGTTILLTANFGASGLYSIAVRNGTAGAISGTQPLMIQ